MRFLELLPWVVLSLPFTACAFEITGVEHPSSVKVGGDPGDLTVSWSGSAAFPVTVGFRLKADAECPEGLTCFSAVRPFNDEVQPIVFAGALVCTGEISSPAFMDYEVVLIDEDQVEAGPVDAGFTCEP